MSSKLLRRYVIIKTEKSTHRHGTENRAQTFTMFHMGNLANKRELTELISDDSSVDVRE